jgi:signal transduction histidine kinase
VPAGTRTPTFEIPYQDARFSGYYTVHVFPTLENQITVDFIDISDRKAAEQLIEAKNKELEQLIYVASHDLRSPLVNVEGYSRELEYAVAALAGLLAGGDDAPARLAEHLGTALPEMEKALARIRAGSRQMDTLLKGLLKLSRSGRAALTIATLDMDSLLQRVVASLSFQAREAGATITVEALPPCRGDEVQLGQVFTNLIRQCPQVPGPAPARTIRITGTSEGATSVYCVADNGIGIDPRHQEKIFELFHRLDPAHSEGRVSSDHRPADSAAA